MNANSLNLTASAWQLVTERPPVWEHRLFAQVLCDEIERSKPLLLAPPLGTRASVSLNEMGRWLPARIEAFRRILADLETTVNVKRDNIFGSPGAPADVGNIGAYSRRIAALYRQAIEWVHSVRNADVDPRFRQVTYEVSFLADSFLRTLETFGPDFLRQLEVAAQLPPETDMTINATITVPTPDLSRFNAALQEAVMSVQEGTVPAPPTGESGYVDVLVNPSMGNLVKIGKTTRNPRTRITELSFATGVPTPFTLAFDAYVEDCSQAETYVHARLEKDGYRVAANREFFNVDLSTAINVVLEAQKIVSLRGA
jgi:hypothetical protein